MAEREPRKTYEQYHMEQLQSIGNQLKSVQQWLEAVNGNLNSIKNWVSFFGVIAIIGMCLGAVAFLFALMSY